MKLGIKVAPNRSSKENLDQTHPDMCEVWFNICRIDDYKNLFDDLKSRKIDVGLHFWGALNNGILANIAYPDTALIRKSLDLIRKTIDIAAKNKFQYVNIHPGQSAKILIDKNFTEFTVISDACTYDKSESLFLENIVLLSKYAQLKGLILTVETVPSRVTDGYMFPDPRINTKNVYELPISAIQKAALEKVYIANDFSHTAAQIISDNRQKVWQHLYQVTKTLAFATRLLHLGFIIPPYNGTDFHNTFENPLFYTQKAVPNRSSLKKLLKIFLNRNDVWALSEPNGRHVENFWIIKQLISDS